MSAPIQVAVVGVGKIARDQHLPVIAGNAEFKLVATVSRTPAGIEGVPHFETLDALLASDVSVDAISLCVPPSVRHAMAITALKAGKHVLLEKPPGATVSEVHGLIDLARAQNVTLFAAWHSQFAAAVEPAKAWLKGRTITAAQIIWREDVRHWHPGQEWIWQAGGFGVFDPGINALSIAVEILPGDTFVLNAELEVPSNRKMPIAARLTMRTGPAPLTVDFDWRQTGPQTWDIRVQTTDGDAVLTEGGSKLSIAGVPVTLSTQTEYEGVYVRFAELISTRTLGVDLRPLTHVADAYLVGTQEATDAFI